MPTPTAAAASSRPGVLRGVRVPDDLLDVPEGVSGLLPYRGPVADVTAQLVGGLRSGMGYVGAKDLRTLQSRAVFLKQSAAGAAESHVHDLEVVHEAPNYHVPGRS